MYLPRGTAITIGGTKLTEHNRSEIEISPERIENKRRMIDGTLRKNVIATKERISVSWENLPSNDSYVVDAANGAKGARYIKYIYENSTGVVTVVLTYDQPGGGTSITKSCMISSFSYVVLKRSDHPAGFDLVNVSLELEEV